MSEIKRLPKRPILPERFRLLLDQPPNHPDRDAGIAAGIADPSFPVRDQHGGVSLYRAQEVAGAAVIQGIRKRLEAGLQLPLYVDDILRQMDPIDEGPLPARILNVSQLDRNTDLLAVVAGPKTVTALVENYLTCAQALKTDRGNRALSEEYTRSRNRLSTTRTSLFAPALLPHIRLADPFSISALASLISLHGDGNDRKLPLQTDPAVKPQLIDLLRRWTEVVITSPDSERFQLNDVSNAIGRLGFRELVPELKRLLDEDLARLKHAIDGRSEARKRGDIRASSDAAHRYGNQYREALTRVGGEGVVAVAVPYLGDPVFGSDAALIPEGALRQTTGPTGAKLLASMAVVRRGRPCAESPSYTPPTRTCERSLRSDLRYN